MQKIEKIGKKYKKTIKKSKQINIQPNSLNKELHTLIFYHL